MLHIGLLADTHIPYRAPALSPAILDALAGVDLILHAGDVDAPWALAPLEALAPVHAVRGNYHIMEGSNGGAALPEQVTLDLEGHHIAVTHGNHRGVPGVAWKMVIALCNLADVWEFARYDAAILRMLKRRFPQADIIVFGHTHRFYQVTWDGTLFINPGAALRTAYFDPPFAPSVAILHLAANQPPQVERITLT